MALLELMFCVCVVLCVRVCVECTGQGVRSTHTWLHACTHRHRPATFTLQGLSDEDSLSLPSPPPPPLSPARPLTRAHARHQERAGPVVAGRAHTLQESDSREPDSGSHSAHAGQEPYLGLRLVHQGGVLTGLLEPSGVRVYVVQE